MFLINIQRRIFAAIIQIEHAGKTGISNTARSSYYRSAGIILSTVVEGLAYNLVEKRINAVGGCVYQAKDYVQMHKIPSGVFNLGHDVFFCKRETRDVAITDIGATFDKLNKYLKENGLLTPVEYRELNWVRKERNKLHIQGLSDHDTGYTKAKVDRMANPIRFLILKIKAHP